jgi:hypothetical protein
VFLPTSEGRIGGLNERIEQFWGMGYFVIMESINNLGSVEYRVTLHPRDGTDWKRITIVSRSPELAIELAYKLALDAMSPAVSPPVL